MSSKQYRRIINNSKNHIKRYTYFCFFVVYESIFAIGQSEKKNTTESLDVHRNKSSNLMTCINKRLLMHSLLSFRAKNTQNQKILRYILQNHKIFPLLFIVSYVLIFSTCSALILIGTSVKIFAHHFAFTINVSFSIPFALD